MQKHMCPVWVGYFLASPLRKLAQSPRKIVQPYIKPRDTVLDFGSAMGFFSIPMAELVGDDGQVICVDIQQKMLDKLQHRAVRAGVQSRLSLCAGDAERLVDFESSVDFALAFAVMHEVPDEVDLMKKLYGALKQGGRLLIAEPKGHVSHNQFAQTVITAKHIGFSVAENPVIHQSWAVVLQKAE